tara:strand:+ start:576 stop:1388 length:813 start_codon:yes stop_codon:yes gene_type:complete
VKHIVDTLIEERATSLMQSPALWSWVQRYLYPAFHYRQAVALVDELQHEGGRAVMDHISAMLSINVSASGLERIPGTGGAVLVANHPTGIADGVALWSFLKEKRADLCFFANRDAVRCIPGLSDFIIPVEWVAERRTHGKTKETVRAMANAFADQRLIVIFPSGRLAKPTPMGLQERPWMTSAISLAQKYQVPIVPVNIKARNTLLYYFLYFVNSELKDLTLFRELLHPRTMNYRITVGEALMPHHDAAQLTEDLCEFVAGPLGSGRVRL